MLSERFWGIIEAQCDAFSSDSDGGVSSWGIYRALRSLSNPLLVVRIFCNACLCSCSALQVVLRPDSIIDKSEEVPLRTCFSLEIPEDPAVGMLLESIDLSLDVISRCIF